MAKTKKVQDFSPAATRIYQAANRGITLHTYPSQVKRVIDKELDKHSLSKEKIKKEISDGVIKAVGIGVKFEVEKVEKVIKNAYDNQIKELEEKVLQVVDLKKSETKELQGKISILEGEKKSLINDVKCLVENKNVLIAQLTDLKNKKSDQEEEVDDIGDVPPVSPPLDQEKKANDLAPAPDQEKKPAEGKKK